MDTTEKEKGSASIEATISLTFFIFVIMAVFMLINFCIVQAKVSYAINTTAKEMSQYSYFYHVLGLENADATLKDNKKQAVEAFENFSSVIGGAQKEKSEIDDTGMEEYLSKLISGEKDADIKNLSGEINTLSQNIGDAVNDPTKFMKSIAALAGEKFSNKVKKLIVVPLAKGMTRRHFGKSINEANTYLKGLGVVDGYDGLNFDMSTIFKDGGKDVNIVACYQLDLASSFPFDLKVQICQRASTKAWLGGDLDTDSSENSEAPADKENTK